MKLEFDIFMFIDLFTSKPYVYYYWSIPIIESNYDVDESIEIIFSKIEFFISKFVKLLFLI